MTSVEHNDGWDLMTEKAALAASHVVRPRTYRSGVRSRLMKPLARVAILQWPFARIGR